MRRMLERTPDLLDLFMEDFMRPIGTTVANSQALKAPASRFGVMSTDIENLGDTAKLSINVPGFSKEDIKVEVTNGNLVVTAEKNIENNSEDAERNFIRRERYFGKTSRSFYVGDDVKADDIKASYKNGVLELLVKIKEPEIKEEKTLVTID